MIKDLIITMSGVLAALYCVLWFSFAVCCAPRDIAEFSAGLFNVFMSPAIMLVMMMVSRFAFEETRSQEKHASEVKRSYSRSAGSKAFITGFMIERGY